MIIFPTNIVEFAFVTQSADLSCDQTELDSFTYFISFWFISPIFSEKKYEASCS